MAINDFSNQNIQDTYQRVVQTDGTNLADGTGSIFIPISASHAITASHAISASHEITFELSSSHAVNADTASFATDFTASGNISASGDIITSEFHVQSSIGNGGYFIDTLGTKAAMFHGIGNQLTLGGPHPSYLGAGIKLHTTGSDTTKGLFLDSVGNITASGDISASGQINADKIRAGNYAGSSVFDIAAGEGGIDTDGAMSCTGFSNNSTTSLSGRVDIFGASSYVQTPSYISSSRVFTEHISASGDVSINGDLNVSSNAIFNQDLTVSNNISASGHISSSNIILSDLSDSVLKILADSGLTSHEIHGRGNADSFLATHTTQNLGIGLPTTETPLAKLHVRGGIHTTSITASGDISASGFIKTDSHITASGNISASGKITSTGNIEAGTDLFISRTISASHTTATHIIGGKTLDIKSNITASGNISASGELIGTINGGTF